MPQRRLWILGLLLTLAALCSGGLAAAQTGTTNLLRDPGFENTGVWKNVATAPDNSATFNVAPDWEGWYTESPRTQDWQNRLPNGFPFSENGAGFARSGNRSQELSRGSATFTAAVYQIVAVQPNSNITGSAWVRMNLNLNQNPGAQARVGIDPNGGNNPFDSDIVWSSWVVNSVNGFQQMTVSATTTGSAATLWLYATQAFPSDPNGVYWDDAELIGGGPGGAVTPGPGTPAGGTPGATAVPPTLPPPAQASFVVPQEPQPDGSIVHTIQTGDTINAISVAYGVPVADILSLNNLSNPRIIQVGQRLIIRQAPPGGGGDDGEEDEDEDNGGSGAAPTRRPTGSTAGGGQSGGSNASSTESADAAEEEPTEAEEPTEEEPTPSPTPQPTRTPAPPAPVAMADTEREIDPASQVSIVCVSLFGDMNANRIQDAEEIALEGGEITLNKGSEAIDSIEPDGSPDPYCFEDLEAGDYVAVAQAPDNYGLTTPNQYRLRLQPGTQLNVAFGAAEGVEAAAPPPPDTGEIIDEAVTSEAAVEEENSTNQLLQNAGLILMGLAGMTLIGGLITAALLRRR
ncbi:MAG: LysM peptidoglycan-binding domain-containing protein [bacterium]|nr:LysM peptidoglycan-binding domain-containing protein [bacterium]